MWRYAKELDNCPLDERVILKHQDGEISVGHCECDPSDPQDTSKDRLISHEAGLSEIVGWFDPNELPLFIYPNQQ